MDDERGKEGCRRERVGSDGDGMDGDRSDESESDGISDNWSDLSVRSACCRERVAYWYVPNDNGDDGEDANTDMVSLGPIVVVFFFGS